MTTGIGDPGSSRVLVLLAVLNCLGALRAGPAAAETADLTVATSASPASPSVGSPLTYAHTVSYASGSGATDVTLTDMLPSGTTFHAAGSDSRCSVDSCGTTVVCSIGALSGTTTVNVAVVPAAAGAITNVAGVAAEEYDPVMTNNTSITSSTVVSAPTYCISGTIRLNGTGLPGVAVTAGGKSTTTNTSGYYQICGLTNGGYTVTPTFLGYTFSPPNASIAVGGANVPNVDFTATANKYRILGTVTVGGAGLSGVTVTACATSTTTSSNGTYVIPGCTHGVTYAVVPSKSEYTFTPISQNVTINAGDANANFAATLKTYSISGTVTSGGAGLAYVRLTVGSQYADTGSTGTYVISGLPGSPTPYTVVPSKTGYTFTPTTRSVTISGANVSGVEFTAAPFTVSGIAPTSGPSAGGTVVTITGSGFVSGATVKFGGVEAPVVIIDSATSIRATSPARALAGLVRVVVTNPGGGIPTGTAPQFTYLAPAPTNRFYPITPCRAVDTRNANGPYGGPAFAGGTWRDYDLRGRCGIPATAQALEINFTVVSASAQGAIRVSPKGFDPTLDLIPFAAGMTRAQFLSVPLIGPTPGLFTVCAMPATVTVHLVIDVFGYHAP